MGYFLFKYIFSSTLGFRFLHYMYVFALRTRVLYMKYIISFTYYCQYNFYFFGILYIFIFAFLYIFMFTVILPILKYFWQKISEIIVTSEILIKYVL